MVSVITGAHEAVKLANKITQKDGSSAKEGELKGKVYRHWSYYLLITGAFVSAAGIVAASILKLSIVIIISSSILFVTNTIGAYYVRKFATLRQLEDYVDVMTTKINDLAGFVTNLQEILKELGQTRADLTHNLDETKEVWEFGYDKVHNENLRVAVLTEKLELTVKKLNKMQELYANLQEAVNLFSNHVADLSGHGAQMGEKVKQLADNVTGAGNILESFNSENEEFDEHNAMYDNLNRANLEFLTHFQSELDKIMQLQTSVNELNKALERQGISLVKVSEDITHSLDRIEIVEKEEQRLNQDGGELLSKTKKLIETLNTLTATIPKKNNSINLRQ